MDKKAFFANESKLLKKIVLHKDNSCHYKGVDCRYLMKIPAFFYRKNVPESVYDLESERIHEMNP